jgi:hypothetical protein
METPTNHRIMWHSVLKSDKKCENQDIFQKPFFHFNKTLGFSQRVLSEGLQSAVRGLSERFVRWLSEGLSERFLA